ncbi:MULTISPECIES: hypothetical protein [Polymorphospora]|uniref:Uncharacterized protein n=1 Tax=Polymorphospora lycopeni TaxID=3140240 RepID=A0ABV5D2R4_9ACTN
MPGRKHRTTIDEQRMLSMLWVLSVLVSAAPAGRAPWCRVGSPRHRWTAGRRPVWSADRAPPGYARTG